MTSELMLIGMKYQQQFNVWLGSFPIEWNESQQQYMHKRHWKNLKFYYFSTLCLLGCINVGCASSILLIRCFKSHPEFKLEHWIMFSFILSIMSFVLGIAFTVFVSGRAGVLSLNALISHLRHLRALQNVGQKKRRKKYTRDLQGVLKRVNDLAHEENGSVDVLGIAIVYFATYSLWFHPFISFSAILLDINPFRHLGLEVLGDDAMYQWKVRFAVALFSFTVLLFNTAQSVRHIQVIVILFVIPLQFYLKIGTALNNIYSDSKTVKDYERHHLEFTKIQLINNFIIPVSEVQAFALMIVARWICVACLFIVVKMNSYVPIVLVIGAAAGAVVVVIMCNLLFPYTTKMMDMSCESLKTWRYGLAPRQKYLQRKYAALRHLRLCAGVPGARFFMFERSTTLEYFMSILEPTIDLMIGYPDEDIKEMFSQ